MSQIPERLVRLRDAAVLERERKAVGNSRLAQQPARLRAVGLDVAPVPRELLQPGRRRRPRRARTWIPATSFTTAMRERFLAPS